MFDITAHGSTAVDDKEGAKAFASGEGGVPGCFVELGGESAFIKNSGHVCFDRGENCGERVWQRGLVGAHGGQIPNLQLPPREN